MQHKPLIANAQNLRDVSNIKWNKLGSGKFNEVLKSGNEVLKIAKFGWGFRYIYNEKELGSILAETLYRSQIICLHGVGLFYLIPGSDTAIKKPWQLHHFPGVTKQLLDGLKNKFEVTPCIERLSYADLLWIKTILFAEYVYDYGMFVGLNWKSEASQSDLCQLSHEADRPSRLKRLHDEINTHLPPAALVYYKGAGESLVTEFIDGIQATPKQICNAIIDCYVKTGRVLVDAFIEGNVLYNPKMQQTSIADTALALKLQSKIEIVNQTRVRRRSDFSIGLWENQNHHYHRIRQEYFEQNAVNEDNRQIVFVIEALLLIQKYRPTEFDVSFLKTASSEFIFRLAKAYDHEITGKDDGIELVLKALAAFDQKHKEYINQYPLLIVKFNVAKIACLTYLSTYKHASPSFFSPPNMSECARLIEQTTSLEELREQIASLPNQQIATMLKNILSLEMIEQSMDAAAAAVANF